MNIIKYLLTINGITTSGGGSGGSGGEPQKSPEEIRQNRFKIT